MGAEELAWRPQKLRMPVKPALAHSVMAAEPEAATTLLQLLYETLEEVAHPSTAKTETLVLDLAQPEAEAEEGEGEGEYEADWEAQDAEPAAPQVLSLEGPDVDMDELAADPAPLQPEASAEAPTRKPKCAAGAVRWELPWRWASTGVPVGRLEPGSAQLPGRPAGTQQPHGWPPSELHRPAGSRQALCSLLAWQAGGAGRKARAASRQTAAALPAPQARRALDDLRPRAAAVHAQAAAQADSCCGDGRQVLPADSRCGRARSSVLPAMSSASVAATCGCTRSGAQPC